MRARFTSELGVAAGRPARQGAHVVEMQRRRLLTATSELVYERGVQAVTIALVSDRAGVSRKTFYGIFEDREGCLLAVFEDAVSQAAHAVRDVASGRESWRERVRRGLAALLSFLDEEPVAGRMLVVEALGAGERTVNARAQVLARIIAIVDEGRTQPKAVRDIPPLTAEGVVGAVFSVIHARMLNRSAPTKNAPRMVELTGALGAMIIQPYLGAAVAKKELERPAPALEPTVPKLPSDPFRDLPIRLTYRTARVLAAIAATPGASGKQIARASEITDDGQMSRLLNRLGRAGLIENTGPGPARGEANAWALTPKGQDVQTVIAQQTGQD
jgi:AcrR family transcriptional regulator